MGSDRPTKPPTRRRQSSQRLLAASGVTARAEAACDTIARVVHDRMRERIARAGAEPVGPMPPAALEPALALYQEAASHERRRIGVLIRAYLAAMHDLYAAALHAVRPGVELAVRAPMPEDVLLMLTAEGYESDRDEVVRLCTELGLPAADSDGRVKS